VESATDEQDQDAPHPEAMSGGHGDLFVVPDSEQRGLIGALPARVRPFASLIRLDRPIGAWLLFWPCA